MSGCIKYINIISINAIYACTGIFTKQASIYPFCSLKYCICLFSAILCLGTYAILWQQIIKKMPISDAYMFKGTTIIFTMLIAALIFGEAITVTNIIGSIIIIGGIALFAKA